MFRRGVAVLFVSVWLALLGIEFCEDVGLIAYEGPEMDRAVETTLASLGGAVNISGDEWPTAFSAVYTQPVVAYPPVSEVVPFRWAGNETEFIEDAVPIYKMHRTFLI